MDTGVGGYTDSRSGPNRVSILVPQVTAAALRIV